MFPVPVILAVLMAVAVMVIIFLLFQQLIKSEQNQSKHTVHLGNLMGDLSDRDGELQTLTLDRDRLQKELGFAQKEIDNLKKALRAEEGLYEDLKVKYEQTQADAGESQQLQNQIEQQKRQVMEQMISSKKLEKELHLKEDQLVALQQKVIQLEQGTQPLQQEVIRLKERLQQLEKELDQQPPKQPQPPQPPLQPETSPTPQQSKEDILTEPKQEQISQPAQQPEQEQQLSPPDKQQPKPPRPKEKKPESPFSRFLKPKVNIEDSPPGPEEESKSE